MKLVRVGMKESEKAKAQKALDRILSGCFDENDVETLFMKLREYSSGHRVFQEVAHFVAHNNIRDRGILHQALERFCFHFKFLLEFAWPKRKPDWLRGFPLYIKRLIILQIDECKPESLWQKFQLTPKQLKNHFEILFKENKQAKSAVLISSNIRHYSGLAFDYILDTLYCNAVFTDDDLMNDLLAVLSKNNLIFKADDLVAQRGTIVLCVMLLMHQSQFEFGGVSCGECIIYSFPSGELIESEVPVKFNLGDFETLDVMGIVPATRYEGLKEVSFKTSYPIFTTNLLAIDNCDTSLFVVEEVPEQPGFYRKRIAFDQPLGLKNSKLAPLHPQTKEIDTIPTQ